MQITLITELQEIPEMKLPRNKDRSKKLREEKQIIRAFNKLTKGQSFVVDGVDYDSLSSYLTLASKVTQKEYTLRDVRGRTQVWIKS